MSKAGLMSSPICLVENVNGSLSVCKDAVEFLSRINEPVVVVSVVGLYRTGKSYLMNRLAGQQSGFALGNTIESKTKGIWMWCVPHPKKEGHTLVLLDTEGLGDVAKGDSKNDSWIFCLAVLLSSTLVYNSHGTIDNSAVEKLHYVVELTEQIKIRSTEAAADEEEEEDCKFVQFFPSFTWVVRDFTLELEIEGKRVTEDDYLEFALKLKKGINKKVSDYNLPRQCIRNYFPSPRKCFVFPSPASPQNMACLESLKEQDLVPDFLQATRRFCDHIFHNSVVKTVKGGHRVTGKLLGHLAEIYVDTIKSGKVPCLENAVVALANLENKTAVQEALKTYQTGMEKVKNKFPISVIDITSEHQKFSSLATAEFMKRSFKDEKGEYVNKLREDIDMDFVCLLQENEMASERKCRDLLKNLFSDMNKRLQDGEYSKSGGYELYCRDRDAIVEQYRREPNKGVSAEAVLNEFLNERGPEANSILYMDTKLTEKDRNMEEEQERNALLKQQLKEQEEKRIESERMMQAEKERQQDQIKQMQEKFNQELQQQQQEMDRAIESKMMEREEMIKKDMKEKADLLNEEITNLKKEKESSGGFMQEYVKPILGAVAEILPTFLNYRVMMQRLKVK
ncbi:guanylate-binding protein 1-like isoform X4 [Carassius gibelio]|uniref:guanylate-binding protein 1-like isoform X4 n=1 Tax=Carassius gibelio TaxID=101364 RepID=UPI0022778816|nr:guanylate-binding protein 1-like isoform X4 [Carassius gibelio]XP_052403560.1 guanylate-binding protein 1-like isoform X4 [Carassius gibelio]XP_052403562.1 guanylate-binding protein 1-like isoform X4 [Carassius gibelio]